MSAEKQNHWRRVVEELGVEKIVELLAEQLPSSDLNSVLLEVFREKTKRSSAAALLQRYESNRFVQPATVDPIALKTLELETLQIAGRRSFAPVQLSPVAPLGSCSIVATVDQNKIISALRGTEVVADATNLLALHISGLLKSRTIGNDDNWIRFCTTHRHVRAQYFGNAPGLLPHFHLFCMVTSGKDKGSYTFEKQSLVEHLNVYQDIFRSLFQAEIEVAISMRSGYKDPAGFMQKVVQYGAEQSIPIASSVNTTTAENQYYKGVQFTVITTINGQTHRIGDGGFVDWPQQLLGNKKERMLISAIGLDRLLLQ